MEQDLKLEVDLKRTLKSNFYNFILIPIYFIFCYTMLSISSKVTEPSLQLMYLFVTTYCIINLFKSISWQFVMKEYKETSITFKVGKELKSKVTK
jgi:bacteriorhodopsin